LTVNGPELIGGFLALAGSLLLGKSGDPSNLSLLSGSYLVSSIASANPMMLSIAAGGLVYSIYRSQDKKEAFIQAGKGSIVSGAALLAGASVVGPIWLGCLAAFATAVAVRYAIDQPDGQGF